MAVTADDIMDLDGQILPFSRDLREALAIYARRTWPLNTSGHASQAWKIPKTTAANLLKGHASDATITAVLRAGGWPLALAVVGATIGQSLDDFIASEKARLRHERAQHEERERRLVEVAEHLLARRPVASAGGAEPRTWKSGEMVRASRRVGS
jgi:hypothetical protein